MKGLGSLLPLLALAAGIAPHAQAASRFETSVFAQHASGEETTTDVSGLELRWRGRWERVTVRVAVPWVRLEGSGVFVRVGEHWVSAPRGSGNGAGEGTGSGADGGEGPGGPQAATDADPLDAAVDENWAASGLGDARVAAEVRVGGESVAGLWYVHGGVKLPTADEREGLGTGEADGWVGVTWRREGWNADLEAWAEWCSVGDPPGYDLEDGPSGGLLVNWPVGRIEMGAGADAGSAVYLGAESRRSAVFLVRGPAGVRTIWEVEARAGLSEASPDFGVAVSVGF